MMKTIYENPLVHSAGLDMVVREDNGSILDIGKTSTTKLYEHHVKAMQRIQQATVSLSPPSTHYI